MNAVLSAFASSLRLFKSFLQTFVHDIWLSEELPDARQKLWDTRFKIIAAIGVIAGAWWAVHSYNETAEWEARKGFWEKQVALYFEATEVTSTIADLSPDDPHRKVALDRFWQLYFGPLKVVEDDKNVAAAMVSFGYCLTQPGRSGPMDPDCADDKRELQTRSLELARRCRFSIAENWNQKLNSLKKF